MFSQRAAPRHSGHSAAARCTRWRQKPASLCRLPTPRRLTRTRTAGRIDAGLVGRAEARHMTASPFRGLSRATQRPVVGVVAAAAFVLALAPAASASATPAHFLVEHLDFTSYQCRANTQP